MGMMVLMLSSDELRCYTCRDFVAELLVNV